MKILAIEASGPVAGCALMDEGKLIGEFEVNNKKTHSQTLVPMLDDLKKITGLDLSSVDAVATTQGPGSFTGLRIGAATAKGIGLALDIPIIGVPTLEAIACNLYGVDALVCPLMDARRQQVYTGIYEMKADPVVICDQCAVPVEEIAGRLNQIGRPVIFLGDGVPVYRQLLDQLVSVPHGYAPAHLSLQRAASVAYLANWRYAKEGETCLCDSDAFRPEYLRKSQAERQKEEAERTGEMAALAAGRLVREQREREMAK